MNKKKRMFLRMVFASVFRQRSRLIVALLAIVVGATILSGLGMIYYDVPRQMSSQFRSYGANIIFTPDGDDYISDEAINEAVKVFPSEELEGYTPYRYENFQLHSQPVTFAGVDFSSVKKTSPYWYVDGEVPVAEGEILIGAKVARNLGISIGDSLTVDNNFEIKDDTDKTNILDYEIVEDAETGISYCYHSIKLEVTGIPETGGSEEEYVYVSTKDMENISLSTRGYDIVEVSVASMESSLKDYVSKINGRNGISAKLIKRVTASESSVLTKLQALVFIVTAVVLVLTMICVGTTMTAVIMERRKEIALRKSLGAYSSDIVAQFMCENLLLGAIGGILGSILGYYFADYISVNVFSSAITFRFMLIPVAIIASLLVTGIACLMPIRSALNIDPAIVLKGE